MHADERDLEQMLEPGDTSTRAHAYRAHAILVAGMHRTGTSAMTRVLGLRGIDLPRHPAPGIANNNDLGFWESVPIAKAHDRFLASIGSSWDDVSPVPLSVFSSTKAHEFAEELVEIVRAEYGESTLFVVKDPRLCRLIPIWTAALERFGARPSFVITTRNPLEVAGSLRARDGFSATKSSLLWLRHVLDAERDSRGFPRVFVSYEELLRDWVSTTDRIARDLHLFWPRADHETHLQIEDFLSSALRHHSFEYSELRARTDITEWVKQVFEAVSRAANDAGDVDRDLLDEIRGQLDRADKAYGPLLAQARAETNAQDAAREETELRLAAVAAELGERQDELSSLRGDNQLVTARLVDEIETVGRLQRLLDGLAAALDGLGRAFGAAAGELLLAVDGSVSLRTSFEQLSDVLRQRATSSEEPELVQQALERAIVRIDEFMTAVDGDRARLVAALGERDARAAEHNNETTALRAETRRLASALSTREEELTDALARANAAEEEAASRAEALHAAAAEREDLAAQAAHLSVALSESEELLAQRRREYDGLRAEAQQLATTLADTETQLSDALRRLAASMDDTERVRKLITEREREVSEARARASEAESRLLAAAADVDRAVVERDAARAEAGRLAEELGNRETAFAELRQASDAVDAQVAQMRLQLKTRAAQSETAAAQLHEAVSGRERALAQLEVAQAEVATLAAELERAAGDRAARLAEAERLSNALANRNQQLSDVRRALEAQGRELADARRQLQNVEAASAAAAADLRASLSKREMALTLTRAQLEATEAESDRRLTQLEEAETERETWRVERKHLETTLAYEVEAAAVAQAESARLALAVGDYEEKLERTLEDARKLAVALAESEDALSRQMVELRDRDERLRAASLELVARDDVLARRAEQIEALSCELRMRDEALAAKSELLAHLDAIGRSRSRRWRSLTQFCSWFVPPTPEHLGYVKAYLALRRSNLFDADFYLSQYPDVSHAGLNPLMHYVEHGRYEGREAAGWLRELAVAPVSSPLPPPSPEVALRLGAEPTPETRADSAMEEDFATRLRRALAGHASPNAAIAVATGGDEHLLAIGEYRTCHFPRASDGTYGGNDAGGDTALIANLEAARVAGIEFLYVPIIQRSLLEQHLRFRTHVLSRYAHLWDSDDLGLLVGLKSLNPSEAWRYELADLAEWIERESGREASVLDWNTGSDLGRQLPGCNVFSVPYPELPHLDESVDIVAVVATSQERHAEAKRVARYGVLELSALGEPPALTTSSFVEQAPIVSIVIPCHEQFVHTQGCIRALRETLPTWFRGEIIIVDDASSPGTVTDLEHLAASDPRVVLLRNTTNSGFLASVNRAVQAANGEYVILLNNDTIPLPGWLPPLLAPFRTRDDVGAVGGRLVYPDGRLQEAGGLVFRDGSAAKFGYGDPDPDFPLFTVPREVDYCSGCLLAFQRDFFLASGGFDPAYGFGFYEDTDFCFRVRALGRVVLYEPESVIVHVEGASAGTDLTQGAKRFQAINASLFTERWKDALAHQHERPAAIDRTALQQLATRRETT